MFIVKSTKSRNDGRRRRKLRGVCRISMKHYIFESLQSGIEEHALEAEESTHFCGIEAIL